MINVTKSSSRKWSDHLLELLHGVGIRLSQLTKRSSVHFHHFLSSQHFQGSVVTESNVIVEGEVEMALSFEHLTTHLSGHSVSTSDGTNRIGAFGLFHSV